VVVAIEDKKMQVDEARQQAAAAANESVIRASAVTGASTAPGKAHKRATVTGDGLHASSTAASSNGGTAERGKKRNTLPPTTTTLVGPLNCGTRALRVLTCSAVQSTGLIY
jgi:hypothetical protein